MNQTRDAKTWLVRLGRFGFAAKGVVYTLIGVLALQAAFGDGGDTTGKKGALEHIARAPFGRFLLLAIGIGIVGYSLWRFIQAFLDTENKGAGGKGIAIRFGYFIIAILHVGLAASAFALAHGSDSGGGDSTKGWTEQLMSQPYGRWLVAAVGLFVIGYAAHQFQRAWTCKFRKKLELDAMGSAEDKWATRIGRVGYAARGVVFAIVGAFLIVAAIQTDPQQARGLDGALATLAEQAWGWLALGIVAAGLTAYGVYNFVEARYRRMVIT